MVKTLPVGLAISSAAGCGAQWVHIGSIGSIGSGGALEFGSTGVIFSMGVFY